jgi:Concanavalin A-like lectin/glucanases superfamily
MQNRNTSSRGMSEVTSEILVIALILVLAIVIYVLVFGNFNPAYMKKTVYVGATADTVDIPHASGLTDHVLTLMPKSGDKFYLNGQQSPDTSGIKTSLRLVNPAGSSVTARTSSLSGVLYGKQLYIYPNNSGSATMCDYDVSTALPPANLRPMSTGTWKIQLIDEEQHVLANSYDVAIRYGSTSLPTAGGFIFGLFRSDCSPYTETIHGTLPNYTSGPGGMSYTHFDGASSMSIPNDPGLSMTGDMAISVWIRPDTTGSTPANWHTVIGKGQIVGGQENDNYQLVTIGNDLYFEWGDTSTGKHYHVSTTGLNPLQNNQWGYVTVDVKGGTAGGVSIYNNGQLVPVQYYNNNNPYPWEGTPMATPPVVNLQANNLPVNVGVQADPSNPFYYKGDIGALSLYNRALTPAEIAQNYAGYRA